MKRLSQTIRLFILAGIFFLISASSSGQTQIFTSSGTFTVPAGVTSILVECWGAGGAGGGTTSNTQYGGGGGAGGAYALKVMTVIPGTSYPVTVGGTTNGTFGAGEDGSPSWFGSTATVYAEGGAGGAAPNGGSAAGGTGSAASSIGDVVFAGGNGAGGTTTRSGGGGGGAGSNGAGGNASGTTPGTGTTLNGGNGGTGLTSENNGNTGLIYGGGGSGAFVPDGTDHLGGNGAAGLVIVTYSGYFFTSSGTFTAPAGVTSINVECWGGGGGGSSRYSFNGRGGGGGGGAYAASTISVNPGDDYDITVGTGGAANTAGGNSSYDTDIVVAAGGSGGQNNSTTAGEGGTVAASVGSTRFAGGNGANGGGTYSGGGGGGAGSTGAGGNAPAADANNGAAGTGTPINGGNGGTGISTNGNGNPGNQYGGGGSGAKRTFGTRTGGIGADGLVLITWTPPVFYSTGSGDPSVTSNWETTDGHSPDNFTDNFQTFVIKSGHTMITSGAGWTLSGYFTKVEIQNSAVLTETSAISLSPFTTLQIDDGGILNHNLNSLSIFSGTESFGNTSTVVYGFDGAQTVAPATYGNLTLSGSGSKAVSTATVNGILSIEGTATSSAAFTYGAGATIQYKGTGPQTTGPELPGTFSGSGGIIFDNASGVTLSANATVTSTGKITMNQGNINTGSYTLSLLNSSASSLSWTSGTITGRFSRTISTTSVNYLFPVGTTTFYRPAVMNFSSISAPTNITAEFVAAPPSGFTPYTDGTVFLNNVFTEGYWRFSNTGTPTVNYTLTLTGAGFTSYLLDEYSRITGRDNSNNVWRDLGSHDSLTGDDISRTGLTNLNTTSFDFAIATCNVKVSAGYEYERNITFDYTKVAGGSDLNNFPVMISVSGQDYLKTSPTGRITNANGYDIIFTDTDYNKLDHQIEYFNGTNGDLIAWVRIPVLSCSASTVIKMLYGNPAISTDPSVTSVWDSHYRGVWHFDNNSLEDFTSYDKDATPYNTPTYPAGLINNSLGLNGTNEYAIVNNAPNINFSGNITISAWINMDNGGRDQKIAGNQAGPPTGGGYKFGIYTNNKVEFEIRNSSNVESLNRGVTGGTTLSSGQWYYVAGISSDVLDSIKTFVNGIPERPFKKNGTLAPSSDNLTIGKEPFASSWYFDGRFDEMRISDIVRSNGWLRTEYFNQSSPSTFHSVNETETESGNLPSESICTGSITLTFGYPAGGTYSGPYVSGNTFTPPSAGTYSITYTYSGDCSPISVTKDIIVTDAPPPPVAPDKEFCSNQITFLQATSGENIRWYSGGTLVSTANPFSTGQTVPGTYTYTVTQTVNGCESAPETVVMTIYSGITINNHPENSNICEGDNSSFTVVASGYNLTYRWQENEVDLSDGGIYSGTTSATLVLTNPGILSSGKTYRCVITSSCGGTSVNSNPATLTVTALPVATFSYPGSPYCINAANPLPVFSGGGVAGTFSSSTGLVFISTATGEVNIAASTPGTYTVTNTIAAAGGCGEVTAESPITIIADLIWTGAVNTDWNNTGNWSCGFLPVQTTNIDIPDVANKPVLSTGSPGTCNNIIIATGSSLTVDGNTLRISGTITNNGTFSATTGTIEMNGTAAQSIPPNTFISNTLGGLTANNTTSLILEGPLTVTGIVYIPNGTLSSDGFLTLASTASGTALIDGTGTGTVSGNVTMQRYLPSQFGYKYFSSPFNAATVNEFAYEIKLNSSFSRFYKYDESRTSSGWVSYAKNDSILHPLHGYAVNFGDTVSAKTVSVTGVVNNGTISRTLYNHNYPYTLGFSLAGNPYPSPIDWEAAEGWNNTNIDNAIYYFQAGGADEYSGTYSTYINGVPNDGLPDKNIIPSMQGFFVHVSDGEDYPVTGTLEMDNRVRITDQSHQFIKSGDRNVKSLIRITARFSDFTIGSSDPMVIYFDEKALNGFDSRLDALKLLNTDPFSPNLYAVSPDGYKLSISALPFTDDSLLYFPLGIKTTINGNITFRISDLENLSNISNIYLHDRVNQVYQSMDNNETYTIPLAKGEYNDRFSLGLVKGTTDIPGNGKQAGMLEVYYSRGTLIAEINLPQGNTKGTFVIYNISGQVLLMKDIYSSGYNEFNPQLKTGIYIVSFMSGNIREVKKLFILNK